MPQFDYKARQPDGSVVNGRIEGGDRRQATLRLRRQGLHPVTLKELTPNGDSIWRKIRDKARTLNQAGQNKKPDESGDGSARRQQGKSPKREKVGLALLNRLLELHSSGLPVGDAIRILGQRLSNPEQKQLAGALWRDLSEGYTLANALEHQPRYFSASITHVIEAGEATGNLAPILRKIIDYLEEKQAIRQKMLASMTYPAFICTIALGVMILFLTVLLPEIEGMLDRLGGEMSWSARLLIEGSDLLVRFGPFVLGILVLGSIALGQWRRTEAGRAVTDRWILRLPLLGRIAYLTDLFQAGNLISTLLQSGINTTETLRLTERTIQNLDLRERFRVARTQVNEGLSVAQAFKRNGFLPDLAVDILTVGENTGNLTHGMTEITTGFRNELTRRLGHLTTLVSSGALITAFLLVALIAIGIVTSVFQVSHSLSG